MKRLLSLFLVVAMLFAALAMVACGKEKQTTESTTTVTTASTTTTEKTTETTTTEATTTTTTDTSDTETTTTTPAATVAAGTSEGIYARFDFGTKTEAESKNLTSHEYLKSHLSYNASYLWVDYDEDNMIVYATTDYD